MRNYDKPPEDRMEYLKVNFQKLNNSSEHDMFFKNIRSQLDLSGCTTGCLEEGSILYYKPGRGALAQL